MTTVPADDPEVLENDYTALNDGVEDNYATIDKPKATEMQPVTPSKPGEKETNGLNSHANNVSTSKPSEDAKNSGAAKPFLPKIFIALLIVLLIAVIALSFVLYRLDQTVDKADKKAINAGTQAENLNVKLAKVKESLSKITGEEGGDIKKLFASIKDKANKKETEKEIEAAKISLEKKLETLSGTVTKKDGELQKMIESSNKKITANEGAVKDINKHLTTLDGSTNKNAKAIADEKTQRGKDVEKLTADTKNVNDFVTQLNMKVQYGEDPFKDNLHEKFADIVKRSGQQDFVVKADTVLQGLLDQVEAFDKTYKSKWGITYEDVLRLTSDIHEKVMPKIDALCTMFEKDYNTKWKIAFKDVIRFTTKDDIKGMTATLGRYVYVKAPPVITKIDHLFNTFTPLNDKWGITFQEVIDLTKDLEFDVGATATDIPVLKKISGWYVKDFKVIWGDSFHGFFDLIKNLTETKRTAVIKKLKDVAKRPKINITVNFLPAKFEYDEKTEKLSMFGFVKAFVNNTWGTIWSKGIAIAADNDAKVICVASGYTEGKYGDGKYNVGDVDRTDLDCLVKKLQCGGWEKTVPECRTWDLVDKTKNETGWDHKEDAGFKCTL